MFAIGGIVGIVQCEYLNRVVFQRVDLLKVGKNGQKLNSKTYNQVSRIKGRVQKEVKIHENLENHKNNLKRGQTRATRLGADHSSETGHQPGSNMVEFGAH